MKSLRSSYTGLDPPIHAAPALQQCRTPTWQEGLFGHDSVHKNTITTLSTFECQLTRDVFELEHLAEAALQQVTTQSTLGVNSNFSNTGYDACQHLNVNLPSPSVCLRLSIRLRSYQLLEDLSTYPTRLRGRGSGGGCPCSRGALSRMPCRTPAEPVEG